ncbi:hypothetical protein L6164_020118 [Bauhinia variegata]|uniref:Uncharacterized protein n=1 Tax=Bauhinia variegata TaxID=167791 RepID=A0ACB9MU14_BAUVA|nr:hypothetical protein L6164_020118 [Bauhinia variegata]
MLYQTHHPLFIQFHPLASSTPEFPTISSSLSSAPLFSHLPLLKAETEMACVEAAALKTSFRKDMAMKLSPQAYMEEFSVFNVQNGAPSDDFSVDDLLDFSHEEALILEQQPEEEEYKAALVSVSTQQENQSHETSYPVILKEEFGRVPLPTSELTVPADDLADLEWLSHFVEDSFSEYSTAYPIGTLTEKPKSHAEKEPEPGSPVLTQPCFKTPVPAKARSKRTRTGVRVWPLGSPSFAESSSTSSSSSSSSSPQSPWLIYTNTNQSLEQVSSEAKPPAKKPKKKPASDGTGSGGGQTPRRCSHCGVQKTPQWRTGPLGAKTLCNACGVRYKSGRLLPEYRPACSPTFSTELHSNHHRKVLEMRRNKEAIGGIESGLAPPPAVPSF